MTEVHTRRADGRFAPGNPGGPGRPRRAVEREYLAALADELTIDRWRRIVRGAIDAAENGDPKAREWIARYALGSAPPTLAALAVADMAGVSADDEVADAVRLANMSDLDRLIESKNPGMVATVATLRR